MICLNIEWFFIAFSGDKVDGEEAEEEELPPEMKVFVDGNSEAFLMTKGPRGLLICE